MVDNTLSQIKSLEQMSYEEAFAELEQVVAALESDDKALEELLKLFERGQGLARHCSGLLEQAELRIQQLSGDDLVDFNA